MPKDEVLDLAVADLVRTAGQDLILQSARLTKEPAYAVGSLAYALSLTALIVDVPLRDLLDLVSRYYESASIAQVEAEDLGVQEVMLKKPEYSV